MYWCICEKHRCTEIRFYIYILYSLYSDDSGILINRDIANIDQAKREDRPSKGRWIADIESRLGKCGNSLGLCTSHAAGCSCMCVQCRVSVNSESDSMMYVPYWPSSLVIDHSKVRKKKVLCHGYVQIPLFPSSQVFAGWLGFSHSHLETLNTHAKQCFKSGCSQQSCG